MKLRTLGYLFNESFKALKRNGWMSLASVMTVAISLFLCGVFWLMVLNVNYMAGSLESSLEIKAFLDVDTPQEKVEEIQEKLVGLAGVSEVIFVSRDQALESLREQFGDEHDLLAALDGENPLPDSFTIKTKIPNDVIPVAESVKNMDGIEKVRYGQGVVEKLFAVINWVRVLGFGIMVLLAVAAVVLIAITIRLTVYARHKEIIIMKYVGATDWFIRWPFFLEGIFLGLLGSLVAVGFLFWFYSSLLKNIDISLAFIQLIRDPVLLWKINFSLMAGGTLLGALGSITSIRRFLKV